jgi:hypothetical protein
VINVTDKMGSSDKFIPGLGRFSQTVADLSELLSKEYGLASTVIIVERAKMEQGKRIVTAQHAFLACALEKFELVDGEFKNKNINVKKAASSFFGVAIAKGLIEQQDINTPSIREHINNMYVKEAKDKSLEHSLNPDNIKKLEEASASKTKSALEELENRRNTESGQKTKIKLVKVHSVQPLKEEKRNLGPLIGA